MWPLACVAEVLTWYNMRLPRNAQIWFPGYVRSRIRDRGDRPKRVWLAITDHYEPFWKNTREQLATDRVDLWMREWPRIAGEFRDSAERRPVYTFFYPEEEYRPQLMDRLAQLTRAGIGDVEIHLHHDRDTERNFLDRMERFLETLISRHGLLRKAGGRPAFGFIHGNWALDNSRADGLRCGLNNEISLLIRLGCYADFTLPSAPHSTQTRMVNTIYWATDDPERPKSHDTGIPFHVDPAFGNRPGGALLMIPGPLGVRSKLLGNGERIFPRLEIAELACYDPPTPSRVRTWLDLAPRIGDDLFLKLHTHGTQERHSSFLLNRGLRDLFRLTAAETRARGQSLYFASAWQIRLAVDAIGRGADPVAAVCGETAFATAPPR